MTLQEVSVLGVRLVRLSSFPKHPLSSTLSLFFYFLPQGVAIGVILIAGLAAGAVAFYFLVYKRRGFRGSTLKTAGGVGLESTATPTPSRPAPATPTPKPASPAFKPASPAAKPALPAVPAKPTPAIPAKPAGRPAPPKAPTPFKKGLPAGWTEENDPNTNQPYYYNAQSGTTQWERPTAQY